MHQHSNYRGSRRRREKEKVWENIWRDYSWKLPEYTKRNSQSSPGSAESPIQNKWRRNTPRHILIKLSKIKYKEKILKAAREKQQITYNGIPISLTADLSNETASQKGVAGHI